MERMAESIMKVATTLTERVPVAAKGLLHLGSRAAVDHAVASGRARRVDPCRTRHLYASRPDTLWSAQSVR